MMAIQFEYFLNVKGGKMASLDGFSLVYMSPNVTSKSSFSTRFYKWL